MIIIKGKWTTLVYLMWWSFCGDGWVRTLPLFGAGGGGCGGVGGWGGGVVRVEDLPLADGGAWHHSVLSPQLLF